MEFRNKKALSSDKNLNSGNSSKGPSFDFTKYWWQKRDRTLPDLEQSQQKRVRIANETTETSEQQLFHFASLTQRGKQLEETYRTVALLSEKQLQQLREEYSTFLKDLNSTLNYYTSLQDTITSYNQQIRDLEHKQNFPTTTTDLENTQDIENEIKILEEAKQKLFDDYYPLSAAEIEQLQKDQQQIPICIKEIDTFLFFHNDPSFSLEDFNLQNLDNQFQEKQLLDAISTPLHPTDTLHTTSNTNLLSEMQSSTGLTKEITELGIASENASRYKLSESKSPYDYKLPDFNFPSFTKLLQDNSDTLINKLSQINIPSSITENQYENTPQADSPNLFHQLESPPNLQETSQNNLQRQHGDKGKRRQDPSVENQIACDEMHAYQIIREEEQQEEEQRQQKQHAHTRIGTSYIQIDKVRRDLTNEASSENTKKQSTDSSRTTTIQETAIAYTDSPIERISWQHDELRTLIVTVDQLKKNNPKAKLTGELADKLKKNRFTKNEWDTVKEIFKEEGIATNSKTGKYLYDYARSNKAKNEKTALKRGFIDQDGNPDVTAYARARDEKTALKRGFIDQDGNPDVTAYARAKNEQTALKQGFIDQDGNSDVAALKKARYEKMALKQGFTDQDGNPNAKAYRRAQNKQAALKQGFIDQDGNPDVTAYIRARDEKTALKQGFTDSNGNPDLKALNKAKNEQAALKQGFTDQDGNPDVTAYGRAKNEQAALKQGFTDQDGNPDAKAYRKAQKLRNKQQYQIRQKRFNQIMDTLNDNINHTSTEKQAQKIQNEQATLQIQWETFQRTNQTINGLLESQDTLQDTLNTQLFDPHLDPLTLDHIQDQIINLELQIEGHTDQYQYSKIDEILRYLEDTYDPSKTNPD